jgi:hypothetical protein
MRRASAGTSAIVVGVTTRMGPTGRWADTPRTWLCSPYHAARAWILLLLEMLITRVEPNWEGSRRPGCST